jgi:hypothetical protein
MRLAPRSPACRVHRPAVRQWQRRARDGSGGRARWNGARFRSRPRASQHSGHRSRSDHLDCPGSIKAERRPGTIQAVPQGFSSLARGTSSRGTSWIGTAKPIPALLIRRSIVSSAAANDSSRSTPRTTVPPSSRRANDSDRPAVGTIFQFRTVRSGAVARSNWWSPVRAWLSPSTSNGRRPVHQRRPLPDESVATASRRSGAHPGGHRGQHSVHEPPRVVG